MIWQEARRYASCVLIGFFFATFGTTLWLTNIYVSYRPRFPKVDLGLIYPFNNHGAYYYISAVESADITLSFWCGWIAGMTIFVIVPKDFILPPRSTPQWITHMSARFTTGLEVPRPGYIATFVVSLLLSTLLIRFAGTDITSFALSHHIVRG